jgi:hypothetical protein
LSSNQPAAETVDVMGGAEVPAQAVILCARCKTCQVSEQALDDKALAWAYRRDVLGVEWATPADLCSVICYLCYVREVLQWAREYAGV